MSYKEGNFIKGEKIFCEGHNIQKPYLCKQSDGHRGKCTNIKHGKCEIIKKYKWIINSNIYKGVNL